MVALDARTPCFLIPPVPKEKEVLCRVLPRQLILPPPPQPTVKHVHNPRLWSLVSLGNIRPVIDVRGPTQQVPPEGEIRVVGPGAIRQGFVVHGVALWRIVDGVLEGTVTARAAVVARGGCEVAVEPVLELVTL